MTFYPDRVEVCGVKVCGGRRAGLIRRVLDVLRAKRPSGQYIALSGAELGTEVGHRGDQNRIAGCIRDFRRNACQVLLDEAKVECGPQDAIRSGGSGYGLQEWIVVRDGDSPRVGSSMRDGVPVNRDDDPIEPGIDPGSVPVNRARDSVNGGDVPVNGAHDPVNSDWSDPVNRRHGSWRNSERVGSCERRKLPLSCGARPRQSSATWRRCATPGRSNSSARPRQGTTA